MKGTNTVEECLKSAKKVSLYYVKDTALGITRKRHGKGFAFYGVDGARITKENVLNRIKALAIPPAYQEVWICPSARGHIQAIGRDDLGRKQYIYHPLWREIRQLQKFDSMLKFGEMLPLIRQHVEEAIEKPLRLDKAQMICAIIYLLDTACIRIGSPLYAKRHKSYGLTTLRKKHLSIEKNKVTLDFIGKNAQEWHITLNDKKIIKLLKKCEKIPGHELFKYQDENGKLTSITSKEVNSYLQEITNYPFTAKNFRTWTACRETLSRLVRSKYDEKSATAAIGFIIKEVADLLGHTTTICQKNYIDPEIITCWKENTIMTYFSTKKIETNSDDELLILWFKNKEKWLAQQTKMLVKEIK